MTPIEPVGRGELVEGGFVVIANDSLITFSIQST
jgi:hypothetical protein